ncbi:hypothetical protein ACEWY4_007953 [Coilia grayii]|uniref:Ig-like domain-containing protein n=1 Tax=Coilia grayii TaxID=363190 RepID=A0ABD1K9H2_9TELE
MLSHAQDPAEPLDGEEYLDISGITRTQAGRYECKASNDVASPDVKYVNVIVNYAPFIKDTKSSDPQVGRMGVLQCEASAIPKPEFKWYRDDKSVTTLPGSCVIHGAGAAPFSPPPAGDWHQVFLLEIGTRSFCWRLAPGLSAGDWHQVFLLETGTRSFCWRLAPGLSAGDWHQVLQSRLLGAELNTHGWALRLSNGQGISIQMMGSRTLLLVSNVTEEDYGNYTCVATNRLGIHNASVFLYRPGTANNMSGAVAVSQAVWTWVVDLQTLTPPTPPSSQHASPTPTGATRCPPKTLVVTTNSVPSPSVITPQALAHLRARCQLGALTLLQYSRPAWAQPGGGSQSAQLEPQSSWTGEVGQDEGLECLMSTQPREAFKDFGKEDVSSQILHS